MVKFFLFQLQSDNSKFFGGLKILKLHLFHDEVFL